MPPIVSTVAAWLGLLAHLGTLMFYLSSGLVAPLWAIIALLMLWATLLLLAVLAVRRRQAWGLLVPIVAVALWLGAISAGEAILGWQA
ncbi:hypothetical protein [Nonomuraea soli]|uniref:CHASE2 domain-containing sensor protein n=1 Tax=Nonomuraea soli TaxID=1032476 RepID=A0A7W0CMX5_9ACTN|nr:hypothetical protein [Nonomuraea soli]MBA2894126.1 CHASE2 domain-containing sensor protein [Nonomuraea soli]